jgi:hypothetical protein
MESLRDIPMAYPLIIGGLAAIGVKKMFNVIRALKQKMRVKNE